MTAYNCNAGFTRDRRTAFEYALQDLQIERVDRKRGDVQRTDRLAAHRVNVRQRVRGGDASEIVRIVDDGREEVDGLHDGQIVAQPKHARVVGGAETHEHALVLGQRQVAQDLRQLGEAEFTRSTRAGREFGEPDFLQIHTRRIKRKDDGAPGLPAVLRRRSGQAPHRGEAPVE